MIERRRVIGSKSLPYDAEIEYLQSSGTQWIDTGIKFNGSSKIEISFMGLANGNLAVYGGDNGNTYTQGEFALFWNNTVFDVVIPTSNSRSELQYKPAYYKNTVYNVSVDKTSFILNGTLYSVRMYDSYVCNRSLYLLATNRGNAIVPSITKLYYCKIYDGDILERYYIPVRVGTTGYLYDKVHKQLFGNAGTGDFILGPDV